jgi:hypothetical protein
MKIQNLINLNSLRQFVLVIPAISLLGLAACSGVSGTGEKNSKIPFRVATYLTPTEDLSDSRPVSSDPDPTYEWFY